MKSDLRLTSHQHTAHMQKESGFNPIALIMGKIAYSFSLFECSRVKVSSEIRVKQPGRVAQSIGHLTREVLGSIPGLATYFHLSFL